MIPPVSGFWLWMLFLASWWTAAFWTGRAVSHGASSHRIGFFLGWAVGFGLLFAIPPQIGPGAPVRFGLGGLLLPAAWQRPLWHAPRAAGWGLLAIEGIGFAFAWWARLHLGRLWSGMMTLREGHRVVDTGPYALVRHPIYTGFLIAGWAYALLSANAAALLGAIVLAALMAIKARAEERLLRRELGAAAYDAYAERVPMLIPFAPR